MMPEWLWNFYIEKTFKDSNMIERRNKIFGYEAPSFYSDCIFTQGDFEVS